MRKQPIGIDDIAPLRSSRRLPRLAVALVLAVGCTPFVYEGGLLCAANWKATMGMPAEVQTPVLDATRYYLGRLRDEIDGMVMPCFQHVPWQPSHVLLVAGVGMTLSMLMLKR
jgi:hypothetical protein